MRITLERVLILKSVDLFSSVPPDALVEVAEILEEMEFEAGAQILREGDVGTAMFIIVEGRVRVHSEGRDIADLGPREVFGELAALDPEPRSASVTAIEPTQLFKLSSGPFLRLMAGYMDVTRGILRVLCDRLRAAT